MFSFFYKKRRHMSSWRRERPRTMTIEGRRHRVDTPYLLPQDGQEISRLDFQHYALRAALGGDYMAPIEAATLRTILDVGCGTGRWPRERAEEFPQAVVTGLDIESHLPDIALPTNFGFVQANILTGLPFPDASFDFVHQRLLVGAIPAQQWPMVLHELVRVTHTGGWVEVLESGSVYHNAGPATKQFQAWWQVGEHTLGFNLALLPTLDRLMSATGLRNVHMETLALPLGKWGGRAGEMLAIDLHAVFRSFRAVYVSRFGVPADLFERTLAALPEEWERYQTRYEFYLVYGQKEEART